MAQLNSKESPFSPGRPVSPEYFVARTAEINRLRRSLTQVCAGKNENVFITGPRGIGKSSLAAMIRNIAEKEFDLLTTHCLLGGVRNLEEMARGVFQKLLQDCQEKTLFDELRGLFKRYIKSVTLFGIGVEFTQDRSDLYGLVENFIPTLRQVYQIVQKNGKKGILLILDDLNGITDLPHFSQFLKSTIDTIAVSGNTIPLFLVLVGIPERRNDLIRHQPSVSRIFDVVDLPVLTPSESEDFFRNSFERQNLNIKSEALDFMIHLCGGYPMLLHEVGDSVFWANNDDCIDFQDAYNGSMTAAENVGRKYLEPQIESVLKSPTYKSILGKIGSKKAFFSRKELLGELPEKEAKNLDNFIPRLKKLGILEDAEIRGQYRFVNRLYQFYIWSLTNKLAKRQK
jgi:AAA+ ATPase superfamily predicted ATPase